MATTIRLTVLTGPHKNRRFCFQGPAHCTLGRGHDCSVRLSGDDRDFTISRHHCQLDIDPPCVRVQDLGSLNGTYRNGKKLPADETTLTEATASLMRKLSVAEHVDNGDIITVGATSFQINVVDCPLDMKDNKPSAADKDAPLMVDCLIPC